MVLGQLWFMLKCEHATLSMLCVYDILHVVCVHVVYLFTLLLQACRARRSEVLCSDKYSDTSPSSGGHVIFNPNENRLGSDKIFQVLKQWTSLFWSLGWIYGRVRFVVQSKHNLFLFPFIAIIFPTCQLEFILACNKT